MENIYKKLQKARCEFQEKPLKKSGHNKFAGYRYFELADFLPTINNLLDKYNLCSTISFDSDVATLTIINSENTDEKLTFTCPMSEANLKGCHPVQNSGAAQTFNSRYLWISAFQIVESCSLEATTGKEELTPGNKTKTNVKLAKIEKLLVTKEVDQQAVIQFIKTTFKKNELSELTEQQADALIEMLSKKSDKNA